MNKPQSSTAVAATLSAADMLNRSRQLSGGTEYLKLPQEGVTLTIQVLTDPASGLLWLPARLHGGRSEDGTKFRSVADLEWIREIGLLQRALDEDKLTEEDINLLEQYGDPAVRLLNMVMDSINPDTGDTWSYKDVGTPFKRDNPTFMRQCWLNVWSEGQAKVLQANSSFQKALEARLKKVLAKDPGVDFSALQLEVDVKKGPPYVVTVDLEDTVDPVDTKVTDLHAMALRSTIGYEDKVNFVLQSYGDFIAAAGASREDFGL